MEDPAKEKLVIANPPLGDEDWMNSEEYKEKYLVPESEDYINESIKKKDK